MMGLLLLGFGNEDILPEISEIEDTQVAGGFGRSIGNKGGVLIRFKIIDTPIVCAGCHLASGQEKYHERIKHWFDVSQLAYNEKEEQYYFENHHIKFLIGDLNFRIQNELEDTMEVLDEITVENKQESLEYLLKRDQLTLLKEQFKWIRNYKEIPIDFLPTYKYDKDSDIYDTSKKKRIPSWGDRILWHEDDNETSLSDNLVVPIGYQRKETLFSDHRPVVGGFKVSTAKPKFTLKGDFPIFYYFLLL